MIEFSLIHLKKIVIILIDKLILEFNSYILLVWKLLQN